MADDGPDLGRMLIVAGLVLVAAGVAVWAGGRFGLGRLPGDFTYRRDGVTIHFPLLTSIIVSLLLTLLLNLLGRR